jgi:hypothetical protein
MFNNFDPLPPGTDWTAQAGGMADLAFKTYVVPTPAVSSPPPPPVEPTGLRAAGLKHCKKAAKKKDWSNKKLRKCKRRANALPV